MVTGFIGHSQLRVPDSEIQSRVGMYLLRVGYVRTAVAEAEARGQFGNSEVDQSVTGEGTA
jgi:hypothetical protein